MKTIKLNTPNKNRGSSVMKTLNDRASNRDFDSKELNPQDLSDLLWAAYGINREDGRRTAPSARNRQETDLYVCFPSENYLYDAQSHSLKWVSDGDLRPALASEQEFVRSVPLVLVMVYNSSRVESGPSEYATLLGAVDVGYISQNINIFCSGTGLITVPRGYMDKEKVKAGLKLNEDQMPVLNNPVGYQANK